MEGKVIEDGLEVGDIYFLKIKKIRYLMSGSYKKGYCQVCGKKRKTTAHHLIPRRLKCICRFLSEVRIRVCKDCHEDLHPENKIIRESDVVKRQSKKIVHLQDTIKDKNKNIMALTKELKNFQKEVNKDE